MTRKHFSAIAADIRWLVSDTEDTQSLYRLASDLCVTFKGFNPNFNASRFMDACGFGES